jgi:Ser/Thr protein kinase RdoA (MazF antagonist)
MIDSLHERLLDLRAPVFETPLTAQALHGDVSLSNLLRTNDGLVWSDFEDALRGPVHWDVAGYVMSLRDRGADSEFVARMLDAYGWEDERTLAPFTPAHDVYGEIWHLYDAQRRRLLS